MAQFTYRYDGSFSGFLCCVYDYYVNREEPVHIFPPEETRLTLFEERCVATDEAHAARVHRSLAARISPAAQKLVERGFCSCAPEREMLLFRFIRMGYEKGGAVLAALAHPDVAPLLEATAHGGELQLLRGFVRFSELGASSSRRSSRKTAYCPIWRRTSAPAAAGTLSHLRPHAPRGARLGTRPLCDFADEEFHMAVPDARKKPTAASGGISTIR
jgi:hypothetical protein